MDEMAAKVLAEVWTTDIIVSCVVLSEGRNVAVFDDPIEECDLDTARARIAACAPEFARLLLEAEWEGCESQPYDGCDSACPWCGALQARYEAGELRIGPHAPSCPWLLLMRRAGVRE